MKRFIEGADRGRTTPFPDRLEDPDRWTYRSPSHRISLFTRVSEEVAHDRDQSDWPELSRLLADEFETRGVCREERMPSACRLAPGGGRADLNKREAIVAELPRLRRHARALVGDSDAADDLVQDCVERSLSRLHQFRDDTDMRAWLFTIMHGIFVNGVSRRKKTVDIEELNPNYETRLATPPELGQGLVMRDLEAALARLSDEQREIVILIGLENVTYKQAAEIIGVPLGTVMSRLARGRERLGQLMAGEDLAVLRRAK